ncbi:MAG: DUF4276 family protein [Thermodesulfobacteriota bacterium]
MHFEFLVEEESAETALYNLVPKIVGPAISYNIRVFQGKFDLLKKLPERLRGYRHWLPEDWLIIVLLDRDQEDCFQLKAKMEEIARGEGLSTKSNPNHSGKIQVLNRIAIQELEAWFFGDVIALKTAYPRIPKALDRNSRYRNPDAIDHTWESLERVLKRAGYYRGGLP